MRILFIHQNFPGQFPHLAPALAAKGHDVRALHMRRDLPETWQGVRLVSYSASRGTAPNIHPWAAETETKIIRGEACFRACLQLNQQGFTPDVIIAHHGWGESLFVKDVWPQAKLGVYCEFYYCLEGADTGFDPEFPIQDEGESCRLRMKNVNNLMHFEIADAGISPTRWQASTFPERFRNKITVVHDGIDTTRLAPNPNVSLTLNNNIVLTRKDPVITFINRNLEPYRGYHVFMRALPDLLKRNPKARVLIIGGNEVSYGAAAPQGTTWKDIFLNEVKDRLDLGRVHFLGRISYDLYMAVMQLSSVHVYLTYPFVLSWSLLEAMSMECCIVAGNTKPLHEAIDHDKTGRLVDFFDVQGFADNVTELLNNPKERCRLGRKAREFAVANYDLKTVCLPRQIEWVEGLAV
ncbi:Glycosyltransferase involved in cell wall bisynthesis [Desulfonatronum zhilinae]|nr:Glycosyltransferase involved in cell wall bisynthesis [Desulfonatronum zhilinae]